MERWRDYFAEVLNPKEYYETEEQSVDNKNIASNGISVDHQPKTK